MELEILLDCFRLFFIFMCLTLNFKMEDEIVIISDTESDESASDKENSVINDTYKVNSTEIDSDSNFTIGSSTYLAMKKELEEDISNVNVVDSPDVQIVPTPPTNPPMKTPFQNRITEVTFKFFSPEANQVPEIFIVPPSTDRKRVRGSNRTPRRTMRISTGNSYQDNRSSILRTVKEFKEWEEPTVVVDPQQNKVSIQIKSPGKSPNQMVQASFDLSGVQPIGSIVLKSGKKDFLFVSTLV